MFKFIQIGKLNPFFGHVWVGFHCIFIGEKPSLRLRNSQPVISIIFLPSKTYLSCLTSSSNFWNNSFCSSPCTTVFPIFRVTTLSSNAATLRNWNLKKEKFKIKIKSKIDCFGIFAFVRLRSETVEDVKQLKYVFEGRKIIDITGWEFHKRKLDFSPINMQWKPTQTWPKKGFNLPIWMNLNN